MKHNAGFAAYLLVRHFLSARVDKDWRAYAKARGFMVHVGGVGEGLLLFGVRDGTVVSLGRVSRDSRQSASRSTRAAAFFAAPLPEDLHISREGYGAIMPKA